MNENILHLLMEIFEICILPLLGILTAYAVKYIQAKKEEIVVSTDSKLMQKYVAMLADTVTDCVIATNQTYVESLKNQNAFDKDAQRKAFEMTLQSVLNILSDEAKVYLSSAYGDLNEYITKQIESTVNQNKITTEVE